MAKLEKKVLWQVDTSYRARMKGKAGMRMGQLSFIILAASKEAAIEAARKATIADTEWLHGVAKLEIGTVFAYTYTGECVEISRRETVFSLVK